MLSYLIKGILIGLIFGVPAGAIGALAIQRTMERGFAAGIITGAGSSAADLIYAATGVFGITVVSNFLTEHQHILSGIGGTIVMAFGIRILCKKEITAKQRTAGRGMVFYFLSSFGTAILNPAAVLSFLIAFTAFDITEPPGSIGGVWLILGILLGTFIWWLALCTIVWHFRGKITGKIYQFLNVILGGFLIVFGGIMAVRGIIK